MIHINYDHRTISWGNCEVNFIKNETITVPPRTSISTFVSIHNPEIETGDIFRELIWVTISCLEMPLSVVMTIIKDA